MSIEQAGNGDIRKTGDGHGAYDALLGRIFQAYESGHRQAAQAVNNLKVTYFAYFGGCTPPEAGYSPAI